jgi:hypothetical protein
MIFRNFRECTKQFFWNCKQAILMLNIQHISCHSQPLRQSESPISNKGLKWQQIIDGSNYKGRNISPKRAFWLVWNSTSTLSRCIDEFCPRQNPQKHLFKVDLSIESDLKSAHNKDKSVLRIKSVN